jgi:hypothetical protein
MLLRAFAGIGLVVISFGATDWHSLTPLNAVQSRMVGLVGFPEAIYQAHGSLILKGTSPDDVLMP